MQFGECASKQNIHLVETILPPPPPPYENHSLGFVTLIWDHQYCEETAP